MSNDCGIYPMLHLMKKILHTEVFIFIEQQAGLLDEAS